MKLLGLYMMLSFIVPAWHADIQEAQKIAAEDKKLILLNFSGSDWCGPCIRLHKEIFESDAFSSYAGENLVLVNADFPRLKKNQLSKEQVEKNETLAEQYNPGGSFPYTVLLNPKGQVLKAFEGYPGVSPEAFVKELKEASGSN